MEGKIEGRKEGWEEQIKKKLEKVEMNQGRRKEREERGLTVSGEEWQEELI